MGSELLNKIRQAVSQLAFKRIGIFILGCVLSLGIKVILTNAFISFGLSVKWAYLFCHIIILLFSFYYHSTFTFGFKRKKFRGLLKAFIIFFNSVALLKLLDYFIVVAGSELLMNYVREKTSLTQENIRLIVSSCIFLTSGMIFVLRYFIYKYIFTPKNNDSSSEGRQAQLDYYTGKVKQTYCGFVQDKELRENAASGGIVSGLLLSMLKAGSIDGALTYSFVTEDGKFKVKPRIVFDKAGLLDTQGSIYYSFPALNAEAMSLIRKFDGRLAVVGLPCNLSALRKMIDKDDVLKEKIVLMVGLFCGHTSKPDLIETVLKQKKLSPADISRFRFRKGLWRGYVEAFDNADRRFTWNTSLYSLYQNLFIKSAPQCLSCFDHYAENADVSVGDIWLLKYKRAAVKPSIFATRTKVGHLAVEEAVKNGMLEVEEVSQATLFKANKRAAVFHKAIAARAFAAKLYGIKIKVPDSAGKSRWNEVIAGIIVLGLYRFSVGKRGYLLFKMPRFILKVLLYGFKGLTNF